MRKLSLLLFVVCLVSVGFIGSQYYMGRRYEQQVEAGYRRALGEFATHLQELAQEIGKARLSVSPRQCQKIASNIGRLVYAIQSNMGELPLGEIQLERLAYFLSNVGEQSECWGWENDLEKVDHFFEVARSASQELQQILIHKEKEFPWVSWHQYFSNTVAVPGFMQTLTLINDGLGQQPMPRQRKEIIGAEINGEQALEMAQGFFGTKWNFQISNESEGVIPSFTLEAQEGAEHIIVEMSQKGGLVLWMISTKEVPRSKIEVGELIRLGEEFLTERGFPVLHLTDVQVLQHRATLTFVPMRDSILYYAEPIKIQMSAFDGSVVGFWATPFYLAQSRLPPRTLVSSPAWELQEKVKENVEILDQKLALIPNGDQEEVLVHRLGVRYQDEYFLIYLNEQNGEEEQIVQVYSPQFF